MLHFVFPATGRGPMLHLVAAEGRAKRYRIPVSTTVSLAFGNRLRTRNMATVFVLAE